MADHGRMISFIWSVADLIRDRFKRGEYADVILPLTVLRRIDCVIRPTQDAVRAKSAELAKMNIDDPEPILRKTAGVAFYNTSRYDFQRLLEDPANIDQNIQHYINDFSPNMQEVIENFELRNTLAKLAKHKLTFQVFQKFSEIDLHPDVVSNHDMGYIFEELLRKFNELLDENPGEHFTPREVIRLMTELMLATDHEELKTPGIIRQVMDPCCGSGGMLTICKERIKRMNPRARVEVYGQEVNPKTYAVTKSDMLIIAPDGKDADRIRFGSTLSEDKFPGETFHYLIANPPYGKDWNADKTEVEAEHALGKAGRFAPGLPRKSDGQTLFLLHMLAKMKPASEGGSRIAIVMNGSPLFTGDANSGESEIRRHVMENDLLEAIVAMPEQIFYNTGIATYVWIISNRKQAHRKGKVQLIDASGEDFWKPMRRSLGDKRREMDESHIARVMGIYRDFEVDSPVSKVYPTTFFGYRKVTVDRPLQLNIQASEERMARLDDQKTIQKLDEEDRAELREMIEGMSTEMYMDRANCVTDLKAAAKASGMKLRAPLQKAVIAALSERDEEAAVCTNAKGVEEHDGNLRDSERIPLDVDIDAYMQKEVWPHVPDAWVNEKMTDKTTGEVGKIGYEINFNRYFYVYTPPRPLEEIEGEILDLQGKINDLMGQLFE